jgi:hypothetical protein
MGTGVRDTEGLVFTWENGTPVLPDYVTKPSARRRWAVGRRGWCCMG